MKIIIADPLARVRFSMRVLLEQQPGWTVSAEAADCHELFDLMVSKHPDLVLIDWNLPDLPADHLLTLLRQQFPDLLIVSISTRAELAQVALQSGANACACKTEPPQKLLKTLQDLEEHVIKKVDGSYSC